MGGIFIFIQILKEHSVSKRGDTDQTPLSAPSDLGLHCLPLSHKKDAILIWVKKFFKHFVGAVFKLLVKCISLNW